MVRSFLTTVLAASLAGCAGVRAKMPFIGHDQASATPAPAYHRDPHRQYFDKLHKRYYYYDSDRKSYFWENGKPKG